MACTGGCITVVFFLFTSNSGAVIRRPIITPIGQTVITAAGSPAKAGVAKAESAKQVAAANMNNRFLTSTTPKTVLYPVRIPDKFRRKMHVQM